MSTALAAALGASYLWQHSQRRDGALQEMPREQAERLLTRAAPLLRLPTSPNSVPEVLPNGAGLRCPVTSTLYPYRNGVLDLLGSDLPLTEIQQLLNSPASAWVYDRFRDTLLGVLGLPDFPEEVAAIQKRLGLRPGDTILDLACGHGNFTVEWAKRVGLDGLAIGLDLSPAMLARAAYHLQQWGLENVLLVRGDALHLPLADASLSKVNCSGGFHQLPDLQRALEEIARVSVPGAVLTASTFAEAPDDGQAAIKRWLENRFEMNFVHLAELGRQLSALGYRDYHWSLPGGWFGYSSATRSASPE